MNFFKLPRSLCGIVAWLMGILLPVSCIMEEDFLNTSKKLPSDPPCTRAASGSDTSGDVFSYIDPRLEPVITTLQAIEEKIHFMDSFLELFGLPLWNYSVIEEDENQTCYFVPVFNVDTPHRIHTIWFFVIEDGLMSYAPIQRDNESISENGQDFLFDALSYLVFGEADSSFVFKRDTPQTRAWVTVTSCWDVYTGTEATGMAYQYTECSDKTVWVEQLSYQSTNSSGMGGSNLPVGSSGGTNSDSSSAKDIFKNDKFNEDDWRKVDSLLVDILKDCAGNKLLREVRNMLGGDKIKIQLADEDGSSYNFIDKILSLSSRENKSGQLFHELWHIYQYSQETTSSFRNSMLNQEIEAHYAQYLYESSKGWYEGSKYEDYYKRSKRGRAIAYLKKYVDPKGIYAIGANKDSYDIYIEFTLIPVFHRWGYSDYPYDANKSGLFNFTNLQHLKKDCIR